MRSVGLIYPSISLPLCPAMVPGPEGIRGRISPGDAHGTGGRYICIPPRACFGEFLEQSRQSSAWVGTENTAVIDDTRGCAQVAVDSALEGVADRVNATASSW
jgi:hypothetical protein